MFSQWIHGNNDLSQHARNKITKTTEANSINYMPSLLLDSLLHRPIFSRVVYLTLGEIIWLPQWQWSNPGVWVKSALNLLSQKTTVPNIVFLYHTVFLMKTSHTNLYVFLQWNILELPQVRQSSPGGWINIKMPSYQYRKSHSGDKTILWPSYLHNGISYTVKMTSLYWIGAQEIYARLTANPLFIITSDLAVYICWHTLRLCDVFSGKPWKYWLQQGSKE